MSKIQKNRLRRGYTTGTCAAAAAKAAAFVLMQDLERRDISKLSVEEGNPDDISLKVPDHISLQMPDGHRTMLEISSIRREKDAVTCGVIKDAGDDPDITDGMMVMARVSLSDIQGVSIDGGTGVGRVTKPGLDQPVGNAAINSVPRRMITQAVEDVLKERPLESGGLSVVISIPGGEEKALHTMNPELGIEGGLSVLGTSGIVEPMSERALLDTIKISIRQRLMLGDKILVMAPGNYGVDFLTENYQIDKSRIVKISNYIGDSLDMAAAQGAENILLAGHIGKLVKVAGGIMNTHSSYADSRMEIITAHAAMCGADTETLKRIMDCVTTDSAIGILDEACLLKAVMPSIVSKAERYLSKRADSSMKIGVIMFSNVHGILGINKTGKNLLRSLNKNLNR